MRVKNVSQKYLYEYVFNYFKEYGCELLEEEYKDVKTKMKYRCKCGEISYTTFDCLKHGHFCSKCKAKRISDSKKLTINYIKEYFIDNQCELLENKYIDSHTKMQFRCKCGNISRISWNCFERGQRCSKCSGGVRLDYQYVYDYFRSNHCLLLENEYKNNCTLMKYKCKCGNISYITFAAFKNGTRCKQCARLKTSGKNHYLYNPDITDEDRAAKRCIGGYNDWRLNVFKRDNYKCDICENNRRIEAHHLVGYNDDKSLRLVVDNGITLCFKHHRLFHTLFGRKNNTKDQYVMFKNNQTKVKKECV